MLFLCQIILSSLKKLCHRFVSFLAKLTSFAYGMEMAFLDKISLKAVRNAIFNDKNSILNGFNAIFPFKMACRILNGNFVIKN